MSAPSLPDWAMTVYCAKEFEGLCALVESGLLPAGSYACPECRGRGEPAPRKRDGVKCTACRGWCAVVLEAVVWRVDRTLSTERERLGLPPLRRRE